MRFVCAILICLASASHAQDLRLPSNAELTSDLQKSEVVSSIAIGPWQNGALETRQVSGDYRRQSWKISANGLSTSQIMRTVREQLLNGGYTIAFECDVDICGGFDFRFNIDVEKPPAMVVNLADYQFLSAFSRGGEAVSALASQTNDAGYLQLVRVGEDALELSESGLEPISGRATVPVELEDQLNQLGHAILDDLAFDVGSAQLAQGEFRSLEKLAQFLRSHPNLTIALVGHTDSEGSLEGNIQLSKRRAGSVLERLISVHGVNRQRVSAEGMGFLSPVASNLTNDGRDANRRVEAIIIAADN
jgi:outer membrane protein OmpA-like peptidoglycan-associated protein